MDFFNDNWKEYIAKGDRVLAHTAIRPAVYRFTSFFKALFAAAFIVLFTAVPIWEQARKKSIPAEITIYFDGEKKAVIPNLKNESVREAVARTARLKAARKTIAAIYFGTLLLLWGLMTLHYRSFRFIASTRGVYEVGGLILKKIRFVAYGKITDTLLKRNILDLMFGTGTIGISTAGGTKVSNGYSQPYEVRFRNIPDYRRMQEIVNKSLK